MPTPGVSSFSFASEVSTSSGCRCLGPDLLPALCESPRDSQGSNAPPGRGDGQPSGFSSAANEILARLPHTPLPGPCDPGNPPARQTEVGRGSDRRDRMDRDTDVTRQAPRARPECYRAMSWSCPCAHARSLRHRDAAHRQRQGTTRSGSGRRLSLDKATRRVVLQPVQASSSASTDAQKKSGGIALPPLLYLTSAAKR